MRHKGYFNLASCTMRCAIFKIQTLTGMTGLPLGTKRNNNEKEVKRKQYSMRNQKAVTRALFFRQTASKHPFSALTLLDSVTRSASSLEKNSHQLSPKVLL